LYRFSFGNCSSDELNYLGGLLGEKAQAIA